MEYKDIKQDIYFTSDTHYHHKNIVKGCSSWDNKEVNCRYFKTLEEHDEYLIKTINDTVKEDDVLYHLGDWSFGGIENIWKFRNSIKCKNIHLILGNHDSHIKKNSVLPNIYTKLTRAKDIFSSVCKYKEIVYKDTFICMFHYPLVTWNKANTGSIMLHGHTHSKYQDKNNLKILDVGLDNNPEFKPFSIEEVLNYMSNKQNNYI